MCLCTVLLQHVDEAVGDLGAVVGVRLQGNYPGRGEPEDNLEVLQEANALIADELGVCFLVGHQVLHNLVIIQLSEDDFDLNRLELTDAVLGYPPQGSVVLLELLEGVEHDGGEDKLMQALPALELFVSLVVEDLGDGISIET